MSDDIQHIDNKQIVKAGDSQLLQNQQYLGKSDKATWKDVWNSLKELEPPSSYFKLTGSVSIIAIVGLFALVIFEPFQINSLIFGIISGLLISMATVSVTPLYIGVMSELEEQKSKRKFKELWAFQGNPSEEVAIVLPRFPIDKLPSRYRDSDMRANSRHAFSRKILAYSKDNLLVFEDIVASTNIIASFAKEGFSLPRIKYDDVIIKRFLNPSENDDENDSFKTLIVIGFFSNEVTMWLNKNSSSEFNLDETNGKILALKTNNDKYENKDNWGYGLISKVEVKVTKDRDLTVIVVGGIDAPQTKLMGRFLKDRWREIYFWKDPNTNLEVANNLFSGVIGFNPDDAEKGLPEKAVKKAITVKKQN